MTIRISFSDKTVRVAVELNGAIESLTTELPQRQWVGLTEAEINEWDYDTRDVVMDIEKLLREKNT